MLVVVAYQSNVLACEDLGGGKAADNDEKLHAVLVHRHLGHEAIHVAHSQGADVCTEAVALHELKETEGEQENEGCEHT